MKLNKSLEELENNVWGEPIFRSGLVMECHRLRKIPLKDLCPADLRIMIGQNISLDYLMPLAIDVLEKDPLIESYYFEGDLLAMVLGSNKEYWLNNPEPYKRMMHILDTIQEFEDVDSLVKDNFEKFSNCKV